MRTRVRQPLTATMHLWYAGVHAQAFVVILVIALPFLASHGLASLHHIVSALESSRDPVFPA